MTSKKLVFFVNGKKVEDEQVEPEWTLLQYLRNKLHLYGTKLGCGEGGCGACTVMVSKMDRQKRKPVHMSVNACLFPVCAAHGMAITTVEGIGNVSNGMHPAQERIAKSHGSQCGFCTPGIVMSMYTLLRNQPVPSMKDVEVAFQGNLCRCTGYRPILEGYRTLTAEAINSGCCGGGGCGKKGSNKGCCRDMDEDEKAGIGRHLFDPNHFLPLDPSQEPIFPPELQLSSHLDQESLIIHGKRVTWFRPISLNQLLDIKEQHPAAKIIVGNTEIGVEVKFKNCHYPVLVNPSEVKELNRVDHNGHGLTVGAAVSLSHMEEELKAAIAREPEYKTRFMTAIVDMLHWFAGKQIRNAGCIGGNIMTGSPISDLIPLLMAAGCILTLHSNAGQRQVSLDSNFFTGYRRNIVHPEEILELVFLPFMQKDEYFMGYKQARRRDDDIAIVNAGMRVSFQPGSIVVKELAMAFGGMAPTAVMALKSSELASERKWDENLLEEMCISLVEEFPLSPSVPGGMVQYRRSLVLSFFFKFHLHVCQQLQRLLPSGMVSLPPQSHLSASVGLQCDFPKSSQLYQITPKGQPAGDPLGKPLVHQSGLKQATGEALYCDDFPRVERELSMALVTSTRPCAKILQVDASKALALNGVVGFVSASDTTPESNRTGPIFNDDEVFASEMVTCVGQVIGAVLAEDRDLALRAARLVKVDYEDLQPAIFTIEDAIKHNSFFEKSHRCIVHGSLEQGWAESDHEVEGEVRMGGQEHFYLETQACFVLPREGDELEVVCSTQHPSELQHLISHALGLPSHRIYVRTKRIGGGFGGKESRFSLLALPMAIAAYKYKRPIRCMLDRDEDMAITGGRHPFLGRYRAGFTCDGRLTVMDVQLYANAGNTADLSVSVLERAVFHVENSYMIPNIRVTGVCCRTNLPSNTAFRGFGGPQGMFVGEVVMDHIASQLDMDSTQVRQLNLYQEGQTTHYGQVLERCTLKRCWQECFERTDYEHRRQDVNTFNREHRWKKRGLAMIPTKFGIAFTAKFLNQAGSLLLVYRDGSVLLSHGGIEMGQGLHTKMIQVACRILRIPPSRIHVAETATDRVPNTSATAASSGSDLNGMAVQNACEILMERLEPYMAANPKGTWEDWVSAAYMDRVSLAVSGFYKTPNIGYNWESNSGDPFNYFTFGAACTEVEVDCLTGDHQVLRTDIVMDVGESINPAVDIGQVEGAFVQGLGLFTLEELLYTPRGALLTRGPGAYKIPGFGDVPREFNVALLRGAPNPRAVLSSKAVGEPPLFLASSAFFAIKDALRAARDDAGVGKDPFRLDSPATVERIRMACPDHLTVKVPPLPAQDTFTPWAIVV